MKICIVIPAFNEEKILEQSVVQVLAFCRNKLAISWEIIVVDNGSSDNTSTIGKRLAAGYNEVTYLHIAQAGKGGAIRSGWQATTGDIYLFMDADLATDLAAILEVVAEMEKGYAMVVGSRFHPNSKVARSVVRKFFSWGYRTVVKLVLQAHITDAPCGFKAINQKVKDVVLPQVKNQQWFFDSELVILVEKAGFKTILLAQSFNQRGPSLNLSVR